MTYASPNALSVYRRLGLTSDLAGLDLARTTRKLIPPARRPDEETLSAVLGGHAPRDTEIGNGEMVMIARTVPLRTEREHVGALVLLRDVTDLRRRDRELITKDATIREIHHRVKNNLQTVAALLRLQARRMTVPEAKAGPRGGGAPGRLDRAGARDAEPVDRRERRLRRHRRPAPLRRSPTSGSTGAEVTTARVGQFGTLPGEVATPLAMVLTELLQNAAEHGFAGGVGHVEVRRRRARRDGSAWWSSTTESGCR